MIRVLVADDQRAVRDRLVLLVGLLDGVEVIGAAADGAEALELAHRERPDVIERAIRAVHAGETHLDAAVQQRLVEVALAAPAAETRELPDDLTQREAEVLQLIADGLSNREIAARLYVSHATVKTHVNRIFAKTGVRDRAQAVRYAYDHRLAGG